MARPKQTIQYRTIPPGTVLTFLSSITTLRPQPYFAVSVTAGPIVLAQLDGTFAARRRARRQIAATALATGFRSWVAWYNRKVGAWYYEYAGLTIV